MVGLELIDFLTRQQHPEEPSPEYQTRQATYLKSRLVELERIRVLDANYRSQLRIQPRAPWDRHPPAPEDERRDRCREDKLQDEADFELGQSYRILLGAVEDDLRNCVEVSCETGESVLAQASSADELVASSRLRKIG